MDALLLIKIESWWNAAGFYDMDNRKWVGVKSIEWESMYQHLASSVDGALFRIFHFILHLYTSSMDFDEIFLPEKTIFSVNKKLYLFFFEFVGIKMSSTTIFKLTHLNWKICFGRKRFIKMTFIIQCCEDAFKSSKMTYYLTFFLFSILSG